MTTGGPRSEEAVAGGGAGLFFCYCVPESGRAESCLMRWRSPLDLPAANGQSGPGREGDCRLQAVGRRLPVVTMRQATTKTG